MNWQGWPHPGRARQAAQERVEEQSLEVHGEGGVHTGAPPRLRHGDPALSGLRLHSTQATRGQNEGSAELEAVGMCLSFNERVISHLALAGIRPRHATNHIFREGSI